MRIVLTRAVLLRRWAWSTILAAVAGGVLVALDLRLKALTGFGTADLPGYVTAAQYHAAIWAWAPAPYAARAGFALGLGYLFMPLYAVSFFYSGLIAREAFASRPGRARRLLALLALVPVAGALLQAVENALELAMLLHGADDAAASLAHGVASARLAAMAVGILLLAGAGLGLPRLRAQDRKRPT